VPGVGSGGGRTGVRSLALGSEECVALLQRELRRPLPRLRLDALHRARVHVVGGVTVRRLGRHQPNRTAPSVSAMDRVYRGVTFVRECTTRPSSHAKGLGIAVGVSAGGSQGS
jgi:hypothetical protein